MNKILIFLNGRHTNSVLRVKTQDVSFPFIPKTQLSPDDKTIIFAADNGFKRVLKEKIRFSKLYLFGDFDSLSETNLKKSKKNENIIINIFPKEKSVSDFGCILDYILENFSHKHPFYIEVYGGLGNAFDHEYTNIKETEHFLANSTHGGIVVFQHSVILSTLPFSISHVKNKSFSVYCDSNLEFSLQNSRYFGNQKLNRPSHGLSNVVEQSPLILERNPSSEILTLIVRN